MMEYGILGIIPVIVLLVVVLKTRLTTSSLLIGTVVAFIMMHGFNFVGPLIDLAYDEGTNIDYVWLVLLIIFLFVLLGVLESIGATKGFIKFVEKKAKSSRSTLFWSWVVAVVLFIDETLSCAVLGTLSPLYDKYKIPRATLAYVADSTAAPFTTLFPFTAWAIFYQGVFGSYEELAYLGSPLKIYVQAIPYMFYSFAAIIIVILFVLGVIPPLGAMKKAYKRAEETGELYSEESKKYNLSEDFHMSDEDDESTKTIWLKLGIFLFAMIFLTVGVLVTGDLLTIAAIDSVIVILISLVTRIEKWSQIMAAAYKGVINAVPLSLIVFAAYSFKDSLIMLGFPEYVISVFAPIMSASLFPFLTFVVCCLLTFTTGSNWGITAVYATIGIPLSVAIGADPILVIASIVSGATFGAHICFYADYTVQASILTKIDNMEHALTQLPYGLIGGFIAAIAFLVAGFIV